LSIKELHLNQTLTAANVVLPEGAKLMVEEDLVLVHCHPVADTDETAAAGESAEPEVIGRKAADEEEAED
jgi:hypothetical protein